MLRVPSSGLGADLATTDPHNVPPLALGLETETGHHERAIRLGKREEKDGGGCLSAAQASGGWRSWLHGRRESGGGQGNRG